MSNEDSLAREWLEADGLGGFAMGTASGVRTRRYHALLLSATTPPTGRMVLVNGIDVFIETTRGTFPLSSQCYGPGLFSPSGREFIESFEARPWPRWTYRLPDGTRLRHEIFVPNGSSSVVLTWMLVKKTSAKLRARPFFSGRDYHGLHHENDAFQFEPVSSEGNLIWRPYPGVPSVRAASNARYEHKPEWYRNFFYEEEDARGLEATEDLASPGVFHWDLAKEAVLIFSTDDIDGSAPAAAGASPMDLASTLRRRETERRAAFPTPLHQSADAYVVRRGNGKTLIAGYPWFTDWGRDAFISLRGICLAGGRLDTAAEILFEWAGAVSEGMLPNFFPDGDASPDYHSIDASLWYAIAVGDFLDAADAQGHRLSKMDRHRLNAAVLAIVTGYQKGTRFGIRMDSDALIAGGEAGVALTWMDARVGGLPVTPRRGKPVEVQALWINALYVASRFDPAWRKIAGAALDSFQKKFWNDEKGYLNDVVDVNGLAGVVDSTLRPNQILAIGGLPFSIFDGPRARRAMDLIEERLWTPLGPRSLAPGEPGYAPRYEGGPNERDAAYHQGTVWPWLAGPFVDAWIRARGKTPASMQTARRRFLEPLLKHLDDAGIGHISEIADAEPPFTPRGCPFQAWSVGEILRLQEKILKGS